VKSAVQAQRKVFESLGCIVEDAEPDFSDANACFLAWRHWSTELAYGDLLATHADQRTNTSIGTPKKPQAHGHVSFPFGGKAHALFQRLCGFKGEYEFLSCP